MPDNTFTVTPADFVKNQRLGFGSSKIDYAWRAYNGELTPPLKRRPGQPDDNVMVNTSRVIVDKGVSFLFGKGVTWNLDSDEARSVHEKYLDDTWDYSGGDVLLHKLALNGGITGHAFLKMRIEKPFIKLTALDSAAMDVITADNDYTDVMAYVQTWLGRKNPQTGKQTKYRQITQKQRAQVFIDELTGEVTEFPQQWVIIDQETVEHHGSEEIWRTIGSELWPYEFAPIVDCQNLPTANTFWGLSDLERDIIALNESINRSLSNINRIIRNHAHPKTWSKGLTESQINQIVIDPDGMIHLPGELGSLQNLEMASDLSSSLSFYKELKTALYEISRVPKIAFGNEENVNYLAAVAMQVLYGPLIEKTDVKHRTYGWLIREANRRILAIAGSGDNHRCELVWPSVLPKDTVMEAQVALMQQQAGVSVDTTLRNMGFNPQHERQARMQDQAEAVQKAKLMSAAEMAGKPKPDGPQMPEKPSPKTVTPNP